ncbi:Extracellular matrix-binding ebh, putative [Babesia ovata]|uniref:Extracellular matrix-binding ebh, putative n=1 Tax=Babesia ovata TaxID=189622 RepID=A0A2H6K8R8_9APIC|nr:Extracellular matrix-binding ebh, putative [Babesia ovata]GBE59381.1 Extracellular matrix-binding ebh, putative [Babesia ovata]
MGKAKQAVVKMDGDLRKDLKDVKDKIKNGLDNVIEKLGVKALDTKVKGDLGTLKGKISDVTKDVYRDTADQGLLSGQLKGLQAGKTALELVTKPIETQTGKLEENFKNNIQEPLNDAVTAVDQAIVALGDTFTLQDPDKKKLEKIFVHIKEEVGKIKGNTGNGEWNNAGGSGLQGIKSKVQSYFNAFNGSAEGTFNKRVRGWLDAIWGKKPEQEQNSNLQAWLKEWIRVKGVDSLKVHLKVAGNEPINEFRDQIVNAITSHFQNAETETEGKVKAVKNDSIQNSIAAVKAGCEHFVSKLDAEFNMQKIEKLAEEIAKEVASAVGSKLQGGVNIEQKDIIPLVESTLIALRSTVHQVADELNSVLLAGSTENSIAGILDKITPIAEKLDRQFNQATSKSVPPGKDESPAQAVESRFKEAKDQVEGRGGGESSPTVEVSGGGEGGRERQRPVKEGGE